MLLRASIALVLCIPFSISVSSAATHAKVSKKVSDKTNPVRPAVDAVHEFAR